MDERKNNQITLITAENSLSMISITWAGGGDLILFLLSHIKIISLLCLSLLSHFLLHHSFPFFIPSFSSLLFRPAQCPRQFFFLPYLILSLLFCLLFYPLIFFLPFPSCSVPKEIISLPYLIFLFAILSPFSPARPLLLDLHPRQSFLSFLPFPSLLVSLLY